MEGERVSRHGVVLIASLTLGAVATIGVVWWYYLRQADATESAAMQELAAISEVQSKQIANWRGERLGDGRGFASSPVVSLAQRVLANGGGSAADRASVLDYMNQVVAAFQYAGAALVDLDGRPHVQLNSVYNDPSRFGELARAAQPGAEVKLSDLYTERQTGRPLMSVTIPVRGSGAFILDIEPARFLYRYLESWPIASRTGETILVRREGSDALYLSELRHAPGPGLTRRRPLRSLNLPEEKVLIAGWPVRTLDYREVPVLGVVRRVPDSPWYLMTKIDAGEVNAPVRRLGWEVALVIVLIAAGNAAGAGFIWRNRQLRIHRDREAWFRQVADETPAYLWMSSTNGEITFLNKPFMAFLGADLEHIANAWEPYFHPDDANRVHAAFFDCVASRSEFLDEHRMRRFDGEYRWVVGHALPRYSPTGEYLGHAGSLLDITERKLAEQEVHSLSSRLISAQEEERARLARELHDDLSQQIAALSIATGNLKKGIPAEAADVRAQSDRLQQKLVHLAESVRQLSHELHPAILQHSGLAAALRSYCAELSKLTGIRVTFDSDSDCGGLAPGVALCIYRVAQEALQNVVKHAKTEEAVVMLRRTAESLCLTVADRGVGMAVGRARRPAGLGLVSIRERTRLVNGTVDIASQPNQGTTLEVRVPVPL